MTAQAPRLDHLVIGVRDLDAAEGLLRSRGFRFAGGGSHPGFGTENRLVRFASEYLELIGVADAGAARAAGRGTLVDMLAAGDEGFVGFALRGFPIQHVIERAAAVGVDVRGPVAMSRRSATGAAAAWRLAIPHGDQYGAWWPFFIEWSDGGPGSPGYRMVDHPNGAGHVVEISVDATDLGPVRTLLEDALGMHSWRRGHVPNPSNPTGTGSEINPSGGTNPGDGTGPGAGQGREIRYRLGHTFLTFSENAPEGDAGQGQGRGHEGVSGILIATDPEAAPFATHPPEPDWVRRIAVASPAACDGDPCVRPR